MDKICNYISKEYAVPERDFKEHVNDALSKGLAFGAIKRCGRGFALGEVGDKIRQHRRRRSKSKHGGHRRRRRRRRH